MASKSSSFLTIVFSITLFLHYINSNADGVTWLNPNQTLGEQGVPEDAILMYKKKFYYNDASDDCYHDPVYFNLLFCQVFVVCVSFDGVLVRVCSLLRPKLIILSNSHETLSFPTCILATRKKLYNWRQPYFKSTLVIIILTFISPDF
jgi:hypothetical protein